MGVIGFMEDYQKKNLLDKILFGLESGYPEVLYPDDQFSLVKLDAEELERFKNALLATRTRIVSVHGAEALPEFFGNGEEIRQIRESLRYVPPALYMIGKLPYGDDLRRAQAMKYLEDCRLTCRFN